MEKDLHFLERYTIEHKQEASDETVLKDKIKGNFVLMKEIEVSGHEDFKRMVEALETQKELKHEHLLSLLEYSSANEMSSEGVKRKIVSFFEYSVHRLQDQIDVRSRQNRPFQETEMWSIICSPTLGLAYLQKHNMGHGCVSVIDIFLTPEGLIKINDPAIASSSPFNFVEGYFYSPELLQSFVSQDLSMIENLDIFKSDVFSLGMCALTAGLLQDCSDCYIYEDGCMDQQVLRSKLAKLGQIYSRDYVRVVEAMLEFNIQLRPNFIELEECLVQLLSNFIDSSNQTQQLGGTMKSVRFLSRPPSTIEETQPDQEDLGDSLNPRYICSTASLERQSSDVNQDSKASQEEIHTKTLLKAASKSMISNQNQVSVRGSRVYELDKTQGTQDEDVHNYWNSLPRMSGFSSVSRQLKSTYKVDCFQPRNTLGSDMRQTYSKQNVNLTNMVNKNSKSIVIDNNIPMLSSRISSSYLPNPHPVLQSYKNSRQSVSSYKPGDSQLFTDPVLMEIVRTDLKRIQSKPKVTFIYPPY